MGFKKTFDILNKAYGKQGWWPLSRGGFAAVIIKGLQK